MGTTLFNKFPLTETFRGKRVLNLGCGHAKFPAKNVTNLDAYEVCKPDVVADLEKPLPFADESFDVILANHVMEHLKNWWGCFEECARILAPGGKLLMYIPDCGNDTMMGFRDHVSYININSFHGIHGTSAGTNAWAEDKMQGHVRQMELAGVDVVYVDFWWIRVAPKALRRWMGRYLRNVIGEIGFVFQKREKKNARNGH